LLWLTPDGQVPTAEVEAVAVAVARAVEAEEAFAVVVLPAVLTLAAAVSRVPVVSVGDVSAVALSMAVAFVVAVLVGATGAATGAITDSLMMSSSAATALRGGGIGIIPTDITVTRTITMGTAGTRTVTTVAAVTDTAMAADQGIFGVSGGGDKPVRLFEIASPLVRVDQVNLGKTKSNQTQRKNNMPKNGSTKTAEVRQRRDLPAVCRCVEN
jgi:hypothetical protein